MNELIFEGGAIDPKASFINEFSLLTDDVLKERYKLRPITGDDLFFTYDLEDDRINSTLELNDYDWMNYTWDTKFPTKTLGTLALRFEYFGSCSCILFVKQYLPWYLIDKEKGNNYKIYYKISFATDLWNKYLAKELLERRDNILNSKYAYNSEDVLIAFFNEVLESGVIDNNAEISETFKWESVRIPKEYR